jgi:hypothetical protein
MQDEMVRKLDYLRNAVVSRCKERLDNSKNTFLTKDIEYGVSYSMKQRHGL